MTGEDLKETIEYIKSYRKLDEDLHNMAPNGTISFFATEKCLKYWDMAIKALEQESCEDTVSRQMVKEQMIKYGFYAPDMTVTEFVEDLSFVNSQQPCEDAISRTDVLDLCDSKDAEYKVKHFKEDVECLPSVTPQPKIGHCKDCKWWKDSDGVFRRGIDAESQCTMNHIEVYEGTGYCFMFEPQESEDKK